MSTQMTRRFGVYLQYCIRDLYQDGLADIIRQLGEGGKLDEYTWYDRISPIVSDMSDIVSVFLPAMIWGNISMQALERFRFWSFSWHVTLQKPQGFVHVEDARFEDFNQRSSLTGGIEKMSNIQTFSSVWDIKLG